MVRQGQVSVNGRAVTTPGAFLDDAAALTVAAAREFVSRGGHKLDHALDALGIDVTGAVVVDVGASTGGFTDCVLQRGAKKVYAVDVGHEQLAPRLREDPRVVVRDRTNARDLSAADFHEPVDLVLIDASFIGLELLAGPAARLLSPGGKIVALVKPQFEVGKESARRARGVIRDRRERERGIAHGRDAIALAGFTIVGESDSALAGPKGNVERFVYGVKA